MYISEKKKTKRAKSCCIRGLKQGFRADWGRNSAFY